MKRNLKKTRRRSGKPKSISLKIIGIFLLIILVLTSIWIRNIFVKNRIERRLENKIEILNEIDLTNKTRSLNPINII